MNQGSFCVNQQVNEKQITRDELIEKLENNDEALPRKFISMSSNIPNTAPFWGNAKRELDALCFFMLKEENTAISYFDTSSSAEYRWQPLHKLLAEYTSKFSGLRLNKDKIFQQIISDSNYKRQLILQNQHLVTTYFDARYRNYQNAVLKESLQFDDNWDR